MLAICSDLDETPDAETYFELMRFLNSTEQTSMGTGVGLEVGNSIYFDMPPGHFSYWNTTEVNREKIRALMQSGHIDVLHSYGDLASMRAHAVRALEELERHGCKLKVWVDHAVAPTNLGADIMRGHGDEPNHPAYHADLSLGYGIKYVWRGRVTSVIGQNRPFRLRHLISDLCSLPSAPPLAHRMGEGGRRLGEALPLSDARLPTPGPQLPTRTSTLLKEVGKHLFAHCGFRKYAMHAPNRLIRPIRLRNGLQAQEFLRCNPHWGGVSRGDRGDSIHEVLTARFLDHLVEREGACILYTHLGKLDRGERKHCFSPVVVAAFRLLADYYHSGKILVTTTRRLLDLLARHSPLAPRLPDSQHSEFSSLDPQPSASQVDPPSSGVGLALASEPVPQISILNAQASANWPRLVYPDVR
jgi:hypothetical protein